MAKKYQHFAITLLMSLITITQSIAAQDDTPNKSAKKSENVSLIVSGNFYADQRKLPQVTLLLKENGSVVQEIQSDANGKFEITLELDKLMTLHFEKDDFVEKIVKIDTRNVPQEVRQFNFYYKGWKVDMIPEELNVDVSILKRPVAVVVYNPTEEGFSTDKKYERTVRPGLKKLAQAVDQAYEDRFVQSENAFDDYQLAMKDGNLFLKEGDYENAIVQYEAAKDIMPSQTYPDKQIAKAMELMDANKSVDERYNSFLALADESFGSKDWEEAKVNYVKARDVKPKMEYPKEQLVLIEQNIAAEKDALAKMAEEERMQAYKEAVANADSSFALASYDAALGYYKEALTIQPKTVYPTTKIKEINALRSNMAKSEKAYLSLISKADAHLSSKRYTDAKEAYSQALGIKPDEAHPKAKIEEIDGLLAGLAALDAKNAELAAKKKAQLQAEYDQLIKNADALMVDKDLNGAKASYEEALAIKAKEAYPVAQIKLINASLLKLEGIDKQYDKFMTTGLRYKGSADYDRAKREYQAASDLKPNEQAPKDALAEIEAKLAALAADAEAKQQAIDDKYDGFIAEGDKMMDVEDYAGAELAYKNALTVKSKEIYPKSQLATIKDKLSAIAAANAASAKEAKLMAEKEAQYNAIIGKADQMFKDENYNGAKVEYNNALAILADKSYPVNQIAEIDAKLATIAASAEAKAKADAAAAKKESEYMALVKQGDAALSAKDFVNAKLAYQDAQKVFTDRPYPTKQIEKIEGLELAAVDAAAEKERLAKLAEANKVEFDKEVAAGDALFEKQNWEKAKYKYQAALKLIPGEAMVTKKLRMVNQEIEDARKLAEFHAANDTEYNRQLAIDYPNGLNETKTKGGKTTTRIVIVAKGRGDEYVKEEYSYGAVFYFKNGKKIDASTFKRETK